MKIEDLKDKKITVMGLGLHSGGVGTVKFLSLAGAKVLVTDLKTKEELKESLEKLKGVKDVSYVFGQHRIEDFSSADMIIKNPGVRWNNEHIKLALSKKIPVEVDSSLFFKLCKNPIIGVTGTKGKTTVSCLIFEILKTAGKNPVKIGIGQVSVLDKLKDLKKDTPVVFELSSWRLSALGKYNLSPKIAVLTNIFPDHLNYYKDMREYIRDKKYIFSSQKKEDICVLNWDQEEIRNMEREVPSQIIKFSTKGDPSGRAVFIKNEAIFSRDDLEEKKIIELEQIKLRGKHNESNILAAVATTLAFGIEVKDIKKALEEFKGIAHRLEFVRELEGVKYYNDTAATTPESAIAGIESFSEPIILIAGGADKGLDMTGLAQLIVEKTKNAVLLKGKSTDKILERISIISSEKKYPIAESMEEALNLARSMAEKGEVVLLSPGAASFGIFQNEFDRGDQFRELVKRLK